MDMVYKVEVTLRNYTDMYDVPGTDSSTQFFTRSSEMADIKKEALEAANKLVNYNTYLTSDYLGLLEFEGFVDCICESDLQERDIIIYVSPDIIKG